MLLGVSLVFGLLIAWLAVTAVMIFFLVWRAVIGLREEDQLFIDPSEERLAREQREIVSKLERLQPYVIGSVTGSIVLAVTTFAVWVLQELL
jgi:hypothetical protein